MASLELVWDGIARFVIRSFSTFRQCYNQTSFCHWNQTPYIWGDFCGKAQYVGEYGDPGKITSFSACPKHVTLAYIAPAAIVVPSYNLANLIFGLEKLVKGMQAEGFVSREDAAEWLSVAKSLDEQGLFFASVTGFIVKGIKV